MSAPKSVLVPGNAVSELGRYSFVARQPIFTADEKVFGYELLFRDGVEDYFREKDVDAASPKTLNSSLQMGLQTLCEGRCGRLSIAFANCLLKDYITPLPSPHTVVEVLETVPPDELVMASLQCLKQAGYTVALDDFLLDDPRTPWTDFAGILKVDVQETTPEDRAMLIMRYGPWRCRLLAEKVETREEFTAAKAAGFVYFQGHFFRKPELVQAKEVPANRQLRSSAAGDFTAGAGSAGTGETDQAGSVGLLPSVALSQFGSIRHSQTKCIPFATQLRCWESAKSGAGSG